ncbi:MAG: N-6 DNA methylase [Spirochaetaceae bacterium]|nr:N-6 DNA methylase [Spirochaetaceae bacterium]
MTRILRKPALAGRLGISLATVNNWIKTGEIPLPDRGGGYSGETFRYIVNKIEADQSKLSSRANRRLAETKYISYLNIKTKERKTLLNNLIELYENSGLDISEGVLALALAQLRSNGFIAADWRPNSSSKTDILLSSWLAKTKNHKTIQNLFIDFDILCENDDILGAFYQSIQNIAQKSNAGSYYTPFTLLSNIKIPRNKTILDPCCGSGGILLGILSKDHEQEKVYARDIDEIALRICTVNLTLFFNNKNLLCHITKEDLVFEKHPDLFSASRQQVFDYIITNPPWGSKLSRTRKEFLLNQYPQLETTEIFSPALYNACKMLAMSGNLYFFLPHAFLNVASHRKIREYILGMPDVISIKLLGNAFKGVLSESILLHIEAHQNTAGILVEDTQGSIYQLRRGAVTGDDYIIPATIQNADDELLSKIYSAQYQTLAQNAIFALGIVTGNNNKYIVNTQEGNLEPVYRGKDIQKYIFSKPECFIDFKSELYQQTAPLEYYRQKKIVYRFICDRLICLYDTNNSLLLNSANVFISNAYPMETIVCLFNSVIYAYIFQKKYHSRKVLKSHLQSLPLPLFSDDIHRAFSDFYHEIAAHSAQNIREIQKETDNLICKYFLISIKEYYYIQGVVNGKADG